MKSGEFDSSISLRIGDTARLSWNMKEHAHHSGYKYENGAASCCNYNRFS
jgi:hypothetical protein